jgi:adenosine/AMP kinase
MSVTAGMVPVIYAGVGFGEDSRPSLIRHPGEGRDLTLTVFRTGEIPAFAGMTIVV